MLRIIKRTGLAIAEHTKVGKRVLNGIKQGKTSLMYEFVGLPSGNSKMFGQYMEALPQKLPNAVQHIISDNEMFSAITRLAKKNGVLETVPKNLSKEEILSLMLQKGGVGPSKFAQIISSDADIMKKFSPEIQEVIKKTQSENPFSRSLVEAQDIVNRAFSSKQKLIGNVESGAIVKPEFELLKSLSAGTVGETYLAKTAEGKEVIVKMIKKNVDKEQLELEEQIYTKLIHEFAPSESVAHNQSRMLQNLYKDWRKELDFTQEFNYNKQLQKSAKRFKVADITRISDDASCIVMEKADGVQMNDLMRMLNAYKENPSKYFEEYANVIEKNPWLKEPETVIEQLPKTITKAFDEQFMFMKKGGTSIMHGDPHMGNYFISMNEKNELLPIFIDTGNCVQRSKEQIVEDVGFLANYFVGNTNGLANYLVKQCGSLEGTMQGKKLLTSGEGKNSLIDSVSADLQRLVFSPQRNITDVDKITKTMQAILEEHGLSMNPESATALKAQMQFYTGISEAAALSGKTIDVGTIVKDMPEALLCMLKNKQNPLTSIKDALSHGYSNQTQSTKCVYQFLAPKSDISIQVGYNPILKSTPKALEASTDKTLAVI